MSIAKQILKLAQQLDDAGLHAIADQLDRLSLRVMAAEAKDYAEAGAIGGATSAAHAAAAVKSMPGAGARSLLPGAAGALAGGMVGADIAEEAERALTGKPAGAIGKATGAAAGAIAAKTPVGRAFLAGWTIGKLINSMPGFSDGVQSLLDKLLGTQDDDYAQVRRMIEVLDNYITQIDDPAINIKERETKLAGFQSLLKNLLAHPKSKQIMGERMYRAYIDLGFKISNLGKGDSDYGVSVEMIDGKPQKVFHETIYGKPPSKRKS